MRARIRRILLGAATTSAAAAAVMMSVAACGSDDVMVETTEPDAANDASDASAPEEDADAKPAADARAPFDAAAEPVRCTANPCAVELVAGESHFCARMNDGRVRCWGDDYWGQLGRAAAPGRDAGALPPVVGLSNAVQLSAGARSTCALLADGAVQCWGSNITGELGLQLNPPVADGCASPHPFAGRARRRDRHARRRRHRRRVRDARDGQACLLGRDRPTQARAARRLGSGPLSDCRGTGQRRARRVRLREDLRQREDDACSHDEGEVFSWGAISGDDGIVSGRISSLSPSFTPKPIVELSNVTSVAVSPILRASPPTPNRTSVRDRALGCLPTLTDARSQTARSICWGKSFYGALCTGLPDGESAAQAPLPSPGRRGRNRSPSATRRPACA